MIVHIRTKEGIIFLYVFGNRMRRANLHYMKLAPYEEEEYIEEEDYIEEDKNDE